MINYRKLKHAHEMLLKTDNLYVDMVLGCEQSIKMSLMDDNQERIFFTYDINELIAKLRELIDMGHDIVQVKNTKTERYIKIDRTEGRIISHKQSPGPYKGVLVGKKRK